MFPKTKTEIAKFAINVVVASKAAKVSHEIITNNTQIDPDGIPAKASSLVAGQVVSTFTSPYTDRVVDKIVSRYQSWRENKNAPAE